MNRRSEAGAAARWERQEADRQQKRKRKKEQEELERAVQETPKPADSFLSAIIYENFRGSMESLAGQSIRISEAITNFAQNPTIQEAIQAVEREQRNRQAPRERLSFLNVPIIPIEAVSVGWGVAVNGSGFFHPFPVPELSIFHSTEGQEGRSYRHDFNQLPPDERRRLFEPVSIEPDQNILQDRNSDWVISSLIGMVDREALGPSPFRSPTKPAQPDQMQAKVARAQKLLIDSSNLLSRIVAGLEVTPDEAKALKARLDAGIQAFINND